MTQDEDDLDLRRRSLLLRAAVLFELVNQGAMDPAEAMERLEPAFAALFCGCVRDSVKEWEHIDRRIRAQAYQKWIRQQ
jgi:hypothetical protein